MHKTLYSLNMPAEQFGTHSLRIGSTTSAAEVEIPTKIIKLYYSVVGGDHSCLETIRSVFSVMNVHGIQDHIPFSFIAEFG